MAELAEIDKLKLLLNISDTAQDNLLGLLLEKAGTYILNRTHRTELPIQLINLKIDMAVIDYNRMGTEGDISRSEGGISQGFISDYPDSILKQMRPFVKVGVIGAVEQTTEC